MMTMMMMMNHPIRSSLNQGGEDNFQSTDTHLK